MPIILLDLALGNTTVPQAYVTMTSNQHGGLCFYMLHQPSRFVAALDGRVTSWDTHIFAYKGDLMAGAMSLVAFPKDPFMPTAQTLVYTMQRINELLALDPQLDYFMTLAADTEQTTQVMMRRMMYMPTKYTTLFLDVRGYTMREAWE